METHTLIWRLGMLGLLALSGHAGNLVGYLRDQNWYAHYQSRPYGVGCYEFALNANGADLASVGGASATDVFGYFAMNALAAGSYTVASWDVWWRSAYAFNVNVPASGNAPLVDLRLDATAWGYPAFWDDAGWYESGQTFVATGPVSMFYLRCPYDTAYTLTVHEGGPGGRQIGVSRSFNGGDQRPIYGYGDMPTVAGQTYYARVRTGSPTVGGVIRQMDPRPDYSDPIPGGCLWLGTASKVTAYPDRDLGLVIMSDDDGLVTDLFARLAGTSVSTATSLGQTFIARGVGLISAAFWLAEPTGPTYVVTCREDGPGGAQVGTAKKGKPARLSADPEMLVTWAPGECPLTPGKTYYLEVTRDGGGAFNAAYVNRYNPFPYGQAYRNGAAMSGVDIAGTIMEEQSVGSATRPKVRITAGPAIAEAERGTNTLTIRWTTDVPSDSLVEFAPDNPPYTGAAGNPALATDHAITLTGLKPHTLYHWRAQSAAPGCRTAIARDIVTCTRPRAANLLANPGFEQGSGASPRHTIPGWSKWGSLDMAMSDGTWFDSIKPHSGSWLFQGALNGSSSDSACYQRVAVAAGQDYTFSAWLTTWMHENNTFKYDVWNDRNRLIYFRLGIDPTGGTNPASSAVEWTPRFYSHLRYANAAKTSTARGNYLTVFIRMTGQGGQWHLYGIDDCVLTATEPTPPRLEAPMRQADGAFAFAVRAEAGKTNVVETSTNLVQWLPLAGALNTNGLWQFSDPGAAALPARFYRAVAP
jgi:hypothetical protein